jgi:hypothetical protein
VPPNASFNGIKKIALASDLKEIESTKPIEFLKEYLKIFKSKLDIVHVVDHYRLKPDAVPASVSLHNLLAECGPQFHFCYKRKCSARHLSIC